MQKNIVSRQLLDKLNELATKTITLKKIIDEAKTDLKKQFYRKKLTRLSDQAGRVIKSLSILNPEKPLENKDNEL